MDDKKDNAELIQEYFNILEEHYNVTVLHELYQDGTENIYVSMPDDGYDTVYSQVQFLDYMSDISSIRKVDNSTVRTKHIRQTIIDTSRHGSEYIEKRLIQYVYYGDNYQVKIVDHPLLVGLWNSKEGNYDDNYFIFPCSGYLALEIKYSDNNKLSFDEENRLIERILFDLTCKLGVAVYVSTFIDICEVEAQIDEEYESMDVPATEVTIEVNSLCNASGVLTLYRQAKEIVNPEIAFLHYYKIIEYVSPAVAKKNAIANLNSHLNAADSVKRDYHYMDTILNIASQYRDDQKDDFLTQSVIQSCIDVKPYFHLLPISLQKQVKDNLHIAETDEICTMVLNPDKEISLKKQVANILYSTRNSIVHAKANYKPTGLECPVHTLEEVNEMMDGFALTLIAWNDAQPDYLRV